MREKGFFYQYFDLFALPQFGNSSAILLLGFDIRGKALKETAEERLIRLKETWKAFKSKHSRKETLTIEGMPKFAVNSKKAMKILLERFWCNWVKIESDELRLAALIQLANHFKLRVKDRRLREMRGKYNRNKRSLLNIPMEKCATCDRKAKVRHHIIPLSVGGINSPLNLILICDMCHEEIHPWMKIH
jgi:hypothetical protein